MEKESLKLFEVMVKFDAVRFVLKANLTFFDLEHVRPAEMTKMKRRTTRTTTNHRPTQRVITRRNQLDSSVGRSHRTERADVDDHRHVALIGDLVEQVENSASRKRKLLDRRAERNDVSHRARMI